MEFNSFHLSLTIIIIIITVGISIAGFSNQKVIDNLIFYPPAISKRKQWYRFITCGFIHADITHLAFNMISLYMLGSAVEIYFQLLFGDKGSLIYIVLYLSSLIVCLLPTYSKNKDNYYYRSLGASGAVSAIVFTFIMLAPMQGLSLMIIPIPLPAFIFGIIYLIVSAFLDRRGGGNVNHSAHFWGAIYGIVFIIVAGYFLGKINILESFIDQVQYWFNSKFGS